MYKNIFVVLIILLWSLSLFGGTTGKLVGTVIDKSNQEFLVGVNIEIPDLKIGAATDYDGYYIINNIPPGNYTIKATYVGYKNVDIQEVIITVDKTTEILIEMETTTLEFGETITVIADRPLIRKDDTSKRTVIDGNLMTDVLPVSGLNDVLAMQAGITSDENGSIHIRGGRFGEVAYLIDGTYVRDPFDNSLGGNVDVEAIQEMEVISGTFNAEYGNALSGVVNVVTKEGGQVYKAKFQYETPMLNESPYHKADWLLDSDEVKGLSEAEKEEYKDVVRRENGESGYKHISALDNIFGSEITGINVLGKFNGSLNGPLPYLENGSFFLSGTFRNEDSYLPYSFSLDRIISSKISYSVSPSLKFHFNYDWSNRWFQDYDHQYKYWQYFNEIDVGSYPLRRDLKTRLTLKLNHTLSNTTFYTASFSQVYNFNNRYIDGSSVVYDPKTGDLISSSYKTRGYFGGTEGNFRTGDDRYWYRTESTTYDFDIDFVSQVSKFHQIKSGIEFRTHTIFRHRIGMLPRSLIEFFNKNPFELAFYVQDKIELDYLIMNFGLRFDYYDAKDTYYPEPGNILQILTDDVGQTSITTVPRENVPAKFKISPRIGLAHPITASTIFHFAYGHFFQMPRYYDLYRNSDLEDILVNDALVGNAGLDPEETVAFEAGIKQQLGSDFALDITTYYKDINNLISSFYYFSGRDYTIFINADYGRVQGIDLTLTKRYSNYFSGSLNYTYMIAMGNESDPIEGYSQYRENDAYLKPNRNFYLDFDRRHSFDLNINVSFPREFGLEVFGFYPLGSVAANFLVTAASGLPYTPTSRDPDATIEPEKNSARKPWVNQVDLRLSKIFHWNDLKFDVYMRVENLFDHINVQRVWTATGKPWDQGPTSNYPKDRQANPENVDIRRTIRAGLIIRL
ncbi:carboxypeptidase-like regulatory domain-containing protein [Calditrichota bacterium]